MRAVSAMRSVAARRLAVTVQRTHAPQIAVACRCCPLAAASIAPPACFASPVRRFSAAAAAAGGVSTDMLLSMAMQAADGPPATSQAELVAQLKKSGLIRSARVESAMLAVDRAHFARLPSGSSAASAAAAASPSAYANASSPIGQCSTISSPASHAQALEAMEPFLLRAAADADAAAKPIAVLDVGSGSGYLTACIAHMLKRADPASTQSSDVSEVVGLEHSKVLLDQSVANLARDPATAAFLEANAGAAGGGVRISFVHASAAVGAPLDWASARPALFDVLHAGAAFASLPRHLLPLLKVGGVMIVPVAKAAANIDASASAGVEQQLLLVRVTARGADGLEQFSSEVIHPCSFAPIKQHPPAADVDSVDPALVELASVRAQVADLSARIQQWHAAFKERTGRKPSSTDMMADEALAAMLKQLAPSKRRVAALEKMTAPAAAVNP